MTTKQRLSASVDADLIAAAGSGLFAIPVASEQLPLSLLERFAGAPAAALQALLRFVLPVTGGDTAVRAM